MRVLKSILLAAAATAAGCAVYPSQPYYSASAAVVQPAYGYGAPPVYVAPAPVVVAPRLWLGGGWGYGYGGGRRGGWGRGRWR